MRLFSVTIVLLALAFLVGPSRAQAQPRQPKQRVAVVIGDAVNMQRDEALDLGTALARYLDQQYDLSLMLAPLDSSRKLPDRQMPANCLQESACVQRMGAQLSVDQFLVLLVLRVGDQTQVDITWIKSSTGDVQTRPTIEFTGGTEEAMVKFREVAPSLLKDVTPRESTTDSGAGDKPTEDPRGDQPTVDNGNATQNAGGNPLRWWGLRVGAVASTALLGIWVVDGVTGDTDEEFEDADGRWAVPTAIVGTATLGLLLWELLSDDEAPSSSVGFAPTGGGFSVGWTGRF